MMEYFDIYDADNQPCGRAPRRECHGNPALRHRASQVMVFHPDGRMLLQKRAAVKDIQPGKWDTAVGGHLAQGEDYETAARREMREELGFAGDAVLEPVMDLPIRNAIESEDLRVFRTVCAGPFVFQAEEIDALRWFSAGELADPVWRGRFTPNLIRELELLADLNTGSLWTTR